jgi:hypothetical protein
METTGVYDSLNFDHTVKKQSVRTYHPYNPTKIDNSDLIRIPINNEDGNTLPCLSVLHLQGSISKGANGALTNNAFCHLFDEIRYELNGVEIFQIRSVGMTSFVKTLLTENKNTLTALENAGFYTVGGECSIPVGGNFDVSIPLGVISAFFEDNTNSQMNSKQELVLIRARTDANCFTVADAATLPADYPKIKLTLVEWQMTNLVYSDEALNPLLKKMSEGAPAYLAWRDWQLVERPNIPANSPVTWTVKTTSQQDRPSYAIVFFQTDRTENYKKDIALFDNCKVRGVKLTINSETYPHNPVTTDFTKGVTSSIYDMYTNFQTSYYGKQSEPLLSRKEFIEKNPIWVIDASKQPEPLKFGTVDIKIEIDAAANFPANTTAYCILISDKTVQYVPLTNQVIKS